MTATSDSIPMDLFTRLDKLLATQPATLSSSPRTPSSTLVDLGTPSASIAVLENGWIHSHCISNLQDDVTTRFQAGSVSKSVTSVGVFKLIELGKLELHNSIYEYLPASLMNQLEVPGSPGLAQHITISQLLSHTSGLVGDGVFGFQGYPLGRDGKANIPDLGTIIAGDSPSNNLPIKLNNYPGHQFNYSGPGLTVVQAIMEHVMGEQFPSIMKQYVFEPLQMTRSTYDAPGQKDSIRMARLADAQDGSDYALPHYSGHTACEMPYRSNPEQAAAGLWSTPADLLKLGRAMLASLHGEPNAFLNQTSARTMLTEVQNGVAHSWFVNCEPPFLAFRHAGSNMPGWRCNLVCYTSSFETALAGDPASNNGGNQTGLPKGDCGIAVMTNSVEGARALTKIQSAICYLQNWPSVPGNSTDSIFTIPFADTLKDVDPSWIQWKGHWDEGWEILEDQKEGTCPCVRFRGMSPVRLHVAAHPKTMAELSDISRDKVEWLDLVCAGLEIMFRLKQDGNARVLEVWHGPRQYRQTLRRTG